ncbi:MAG TPA: hypothetical protein VKU00_06000 [Chthonomonadaceae bacterium]|nr:hypothetical protein [Chthonomonadaceae bacterium]
MSILKSRIFRTIALLGCAAFCGVLIAGCNNDDSGGAASGGGAAKTAGAMSSGGATTGGAGGGAMAPGSSGS